MQRVAKLVSIYAVIVVAILFFLELFSYWRNTVNGCQKPFLYNSQMLKNESYSKLKGFGFDVIDLLLGWGSSPISIKNKGYQVENGIATLQTNCQCQDTLTVLITGGSTTDIVLHPENWPSELIKLFETKRQCAKLYIAATGGYNTGQELIKLIRDGVELKPKLHISYSGVNDCIHSMFISLYEQSFFRKFKDAKSTSGILPNTFFYLNQLLFSENNMYIYDEVPIDPNEFWMDNMKIMHGIAKEYNYKFVGLLQPANGIGKYSDIAIQRKNEMYISNYQNHYPLMKKGVIAHLDYLKDLTAIFDTCKGKVYIDDCHIETPYQKLVAVEVYKVIQMTIEK